MMMMMMMMKVMRMSVVPLSSFLRLDNICGPIKLLVLFYCLANYAFLSSTIILNGS